jgi:superfamily II DNA or RNA helicase
MITIQFDRGTLLVHCEENSYLVQNIGHCQWDPRTCCFRLPGYQYYHLVASLYRAGVAYRDEARAYTTLELAWSLNQTPFPYQSEAITAWQKHGRRGYIVLPTGAGKSFVGALAVASAGRSALVVVPTIDLMHQWYDTLQTYFGDIQVGLIGGGYFEVGPLTVITYDSAHRHLEDLGNRFGLIVFDECHHLPSATYRLSAEFAIAPYRLGLSATPERVDGGHYGLTDLIGPCVYRKTITELSGQYLAEYEVIEISARLSKDELAAYRQNRAVYRQFLQDKNLRMSPGNWQRFISLTCKSKEGRRAFLAYLKQKDIAQATPAKLQILQKLIKKHHNDRILIFTHDNATAYKISQEFLLPIITHQTKAKERRQYLLGFNEGTYSILVTSKVLNEGVNIPAANIGVILSGSGSVREHVQRLGRILRKLGDKKALLYEIVTLDTSEEYTSQRRRDHEAYRR